MERGEKAIAYMPGTKEKERRGKEKHKTRKVWRIPCVLNPLSTFPLFPLPNSMPVTKARRVPVIRTSVFAFHPPISKL